MSGFAAFGEPGVTGGVPGPVSLPGRSTRRVLTDVLCRALMWLAFLIAVLPLVWILWVVLTQGLGLVLRPSWWTQDGAAGGAGDTEVGAAHAILGTVQMAIATSVIAVPIALLTAIYLNDYGRGRFAAVVRFMVDILSGVPAIVAGLFVYAFWVTTLGALRVPFSATLALVLLMIPAVVHSTEAALRGVPGSLREAAYALGVPTWKTLAVIVVPAALPGIVSGALFAAARVMGETAPLIILAPYTPYLQAGLFDPVMASLPTMINDSRSDVTPAGLERAWAASLTLILIILGCILLGRLVARSSLRRRAERT
ncbi:MAG: phosphate ABC transporter permease PstA [Austwickia sp.]|nr:phosphate ABC transporter permease PstA [Austwickia sp.]MBK8436389.1 phosphate ABC transporter permease PstA [Austwickia sp.]MBK9102065.1 phosphate ABC transporter permease PstA [Austwickia sp.]